jgi:predicted PurR-regulated permease PerM
MGSDAESNARDVPPAARPTVDLPRWLRRAGLGSWLTLGVAALVALVLLLVALTSEVAIPLAIAVVLAAVLVPLTDRLERSRVPRWLGAALVLVLGLALAAGTIALVIRGIVEQSDEIWQRLERGLQEASGDFGGSEHTATTLAAGAHDAVRTLTSGVLGALVSSTGAFVVSSILALFMLLFLLKDWDEIVGWTTSHLGVSPATAKRAVDGMVVAFQGYAWGLTVLGVANALVVGFGAWALDVPLAATIAVVSFVTSYIPYLGAFVAGAFAVLIAYGDGGSGTALAMLVIVLLANSLIQNLLEPFALGSRLRLHPLAVLLVVTSAAALVGALGAILAAPLVSAALNVGHQLREAKTADIPAPP